MYHFCPIRLFIIIVQEKRKGYIIMSNRGLYKKTQTGWDRTQENEREREKRLYDKISQSPEPVKTRKKSVKK